MGTSEAHTFAALMNTCCFSELLRDRPPPAAGTGLLWPVELGPSSSDSIENDPTP